MVLQKLRLEAKLYGRLVDFQKAGFSVKAAYIASDNGDVHENVAEKQTSHDFNLFRDYPNSSCYLKEGDFGWC